MAVHPARDLWSRHHPPGGYPAGVVPVPEPIPGLAFFPGGHGLWSAKAPDALPDFPVGGVMVLGHDFHSEAGYAKSLSLGAEPLTLPTWRNLVGVLDAVGIDRERCFFTNVYVGLRAGRATTGRFPGASDPEFVAHCRRFLVEQLRVQRPALVLTLGVHVPPQLGALSPELREWTQGRGLRHLDEVGPVSTGVTFDGIAGFTTTVVALIHPSLRHASLRHRRYAGLVGGKAGERMLKDAVALTGLTPAEQTRDR